MSGFTDCWGRTVTFAVRDGAEVYSSQGSLEVRLPIGSGAQTARRIFDGLAPANTQDIDVPDSVPAWKAKIVLQKIGKLQAATAFAAKAGTEAQIAFDEATEWSRDGAMVNAFAAALGLDKATVDELFRAADAVTL